MNRIDQGVLEKIKIEIKQVGYKYLNSYLEWGHVVQILDHEILPIVLRVFEDEYHTEVVSQRESLTKMNKLAFRNDPERDRTITELYNAGYSRGKIAKEVGMSKWGVSKALRRLGVN